MRRGLAALVVVGMLSACTAAPPANTPRPRPPASAAADFYEKIPPGKGTAGTVTVDAGRSLGAFPFELGRQLSAVPQSWRFGPNTYANLNRLSLVRVRVWLKLTDLYDVDSRTPQYWRAYDYLNTYSARAQSLILNWQIGYDPVVTRQVLSERELVDEEVAALSDLKRHYPKITWIEVENEPTSLDQYYPKYRIAYQAVNALNAKIDAKQLPGPRLRVGGPTLDTFSPTRLGRFLSLYKADKDPKKRLDFVSYHQYLISTDGEWHADKDRPSLVGDERNRLNQMFADHGLPSVPALITETGTFPRDRRTDGTFREDLHIQAAGMAAIQYYYAQQPDMVPLAWTIDHPENDIKDLFVDVDSGTPRPAYDAMLLASMLPRTRVLAKSDRLSGNGIGVYALAGVSDQAVAVMTWNYQWTYDKVYDTTLRLANLPATFRKGHLRVQQYRVAQDMDSGMPKQVANFLVDSPTDGALSTPPQRLRPNELRLIIIRPDRTTP